MICLPENFKVIFNEQLSIILWRKIVRAFHVHFTACFPVINSHRVIRGKEDKLFIITLYHRKDRVDIFSFPLKYNETGTIFRVRQVAIALE